MVSVMVEAVVEVVALLMQQQLLLGLSTKAAGNSLTPTLASQFQTPAVCAQARGTGSAFENEQVFCRQMHSCKFTGCKQDA